MNDRQHCEHCGKELHEHKTAWLELSFRTGRWYALGECPADESQGCFPFGRACAKAVLAKAMTRN